MLNLRSELNNLEAPNLWYSLNEFFSKHKQTSWKKSMRVFILSTFCSLLIAPYFLLVARYFLLVSFCSLLVVRYFLLVAGCLLLVTFCSFLFARCSLLFACYFLLIARCFLLVVFCSLLVTFCLFARCLLWNKVTVNHKKMVWLLRNSATDIYLQISEIFVTFSEWWFSKFSQHAKPFSKLA